VLKFTSVWNAVFQPWHKPTTVLLLVYCPVDNTLFEVSPEIRYSGVSGCYRCYYIVESCPMTKLNGGLSRLHSADEDAVSWLTSYGKWHAYEKKKTVVMEMTQLVLLKLLTHLWSAEKRMMSLCIKNNVVNVVKCWSYVISIILVRFFWRHRVHYHCALITPCSSGLE